MLDVSFAWKLTVSAESARWTDFLPPMHHSHACGWECVDFFALNAKICQNHVANQFEAVAYNACVGGSRRHD